MRVPLQGLSEAAKSWLMLGAIVAAAFGAGMGFMGWVDVPERLARQGTAISHLADNDLRLADKLAEVRCQLDELSTYECTRIRYQYRNDLEEPPEEQE